MLAAANGKVLVENAAGRSFGTRVFKFVTQAANEFVTQIGDVHRNERARARARRARICISPRDNYANRPRPSATATLPCVHRTCTCREHATPVELVAKIKHHSKRSAIKKTKNVRDRRRANKKTSICMAGFN